MEPLTILLIILGVIFIWGMLGFTIENIFGIVSNKISIIIYGPVGWIALCINYSFFGD